MDSGQSDGGQSDSHRPPTTVGEAAPTTAHRPPTTDNRPPTAKPHRQPSTAHRQPTTVKRAFLTLSCLTLLLVGALFAWNATREFPESTVQLPIAQYLPGGISDGPGRHPVRRSSESEGGWTYEDLPLGATESLDAQAHEILNLTDFVYRRYIRGGKSFEIYIAYWAPGTMPARLVKNHTPDTCWTQVGWQIRKKDENYEAHYDGSFPRGTSSIGIEDKGNSVTGVTGRYRIFNKQGNDVYVLFWHILDGEPYSPNAKPLLDRIIDRIKEPFDHRFNIRKMQYLIRVSSAEPLDEVESTLFYQRVIGAVFKLSLSDA